MKKLVLQRQSVVARPSTYKVPYAEVLNERQLEAVMHGKGSALVIAGAGTGKTRTLVYRLARLVEDGVPPERIVLLTFTRKASRELLQRASRVLDGRCEKVQGGTFHSFSHTLVRTYAAHVGLSENFQILDQGDAEDAMNVVRSKQVRPSGTKRFPLKQTLHAIASASVNRCIPVSDVLHQEYPRFLDEQESIENVIREYHAFKLRNNVIDYDDLLLYGCRLVAEGSEVRNEILRRFDYCMVDEYQDTNALQHSMACALAGHDENIMVVGDDAQSIYSFRGARIQNIIEFPESFRACKIITLEENYRSVKPILDLANTVLRSSTIGYAKELFTLKKTEGEIPALIAAKDNRQQSAFVAQQILAARESGVSLSSMAVLFRSGFMSFDLEIELAKCNIPFIKVGGLKLMDTAHVKDVLALLRIIVNPRDTIALLRVLMLVDGVGNKTAAQIAEAVSNVSLEQFASVLDSIPARARQGCSGLFHCLHSMRSAGSAMESVMREAMNWYRPVIERVYDDVSKRVRDCEMVTSIASGYSSVSSFLSDIALEPPEFSVADLEPESNENEFVTLSTIHSAKGLEWDTVFIITALEGLFPHARSVEKSESLEEERRLMYVAITRAKTTLYLSYPGDVYDRESAKVLSMPSRFLDGIEVELLDRFVIREDDEDQADRLSESQDKKLLS